MEELKQSYAGWVEESLRVRAQGRLPKWTQSIVVGSEAFVEKVKTELGINAIGREIIGEDGNYELREPEVSYNGIFARENAGLRSENTYFWNISDSTSRTWLGPTLEGAIQRGTARPSV